MISYNIDRYLIPSGRAAPAAANYIEIVNWLEESFGQQGWTVTYHKNAWELTLEDPTHLVLFRLRFGDGLGA